VLFQQAVAIGLRDHLGPAVCPELGKNIANVVACRAVADVQLIRDVVGALALGQAEGLPVIHAVGRDGLFKKEIEPVAGLFFKDADKPLIRNLKERGLMFRSERVTHSYPFGWRTGDPIIYYAKNAWYIRTSDFRDRMVELNKTIKWVPENIRDGRFGNWLENLQDWNLSRSRFWGTPLPLWRSDDNNSEICIGSKEELINEIEKANRVLGLNQTCPDDLHRPFIDEIIVAKNKKMRHKNS